MWHQLDNIRQDSDGKILAELHFPTESKWFQGHFPGDPLVPALAQLAVVREALGSMGTQPCALTELKRIKFKAMIRPGDSLRLEITPQPASPERYSYRLFKGSDIAGSGMVKCCRGADASAT
jgi:3-hydroxymyristoyl/3-hydroxydecanoyl-(acyl carrier protein) dehydratase